MAGRRPDLEPSTAANDFQRAAATASAEVGKRSWQEMTPSEQTQAIYAQLRRIDEARVLVMSGSVASGGHAAFRNGRRPHRSAVA